MNAPEAVRAVLARLGWVLRRRAEGGVLHFSVGRAGQSRALCGFSAPASAARALTPGSRLRAAPARGVRLRAGEKDGLVELRAALDLLVESLRRRAPRPARGAALAEAHEGQEGRDLLLRTTFACNQRCPFCFVPLTGRGADAASIERELDALARRAGPRGELTISGGEPAADPRLPRIVAAARARGFRRFVLQTNGVYLDRPGLLEELVRLGVRTYLFSFHSHVPAAYDAITGSRGQHARAAAGLGRLLRVPGLSVTVNVVVNARNYRDLPGLVDFVAALRGGRGRGRPGFYFSMINEAGHQKAPSWTVALEEAAPFLRRALARCRAAGLPVSRSGGESSFPACLTDRPARHASPRPLPQDRVRYAEAFPGEEGVIGRAKRPSCRECRYDRRCVGVPAPYAGLYGLGALRPVRAAA
ncbi:MAG: radical SAM protein [Elusimicrobia bacterium]|nr:radical SAM protein [Elusimicrobiota bacterium]